MFLILEKSHTCTHTLERILILLYIQMFSDIWLVTILDFYMNILSVIWQSFKHCHCLEMKYSTFLILPLRTVPHCAHCKYCRKHQYSRTLICIAFVETWFKINIIDDKKRKKWLLTESSLLVKLSIKKVKSWFHGKAAFLVFNKKCIKNSIQFAAWI